MPPAKPSRVERRERDRAMILAALRGENRTEVAARYGVAESYLYRLLAATRRDAGEELAFWREVAELVE